MNTKWLIKEAPNPLEVNRLVNEKGLDEVIAYMLVQRNIVSDEAIHNFFRGTIKKTHDPFLMKDMDRAVDRLDLALKNNEKIMVYGDYDVDGTASVSLVYSYLSCFTKEIIYYIPDRHKEGYGVSEKGVRQANEEQCGLIITLDCGIKANEKVELANELGIDVIICDHHKPGEELPNCIVLDPQRSDCNYPYKGLSGCGVGFKLMHAFTQKNNYDEMRLMDYLDLLAISIGADIVPVTGENRILARLGLEKVNQNTRLGIDKMLHYAKKEKPLTLTDTVFTIAPRINAAGRLKDATLAVKLLTTNDNKIALDIAKVIHELNDKRRKWDKEITEEALLKIANDHEYSKKCTTVVYDRDWHKGVIGIVASRLIEKHYRPTIVLTTEDGEYWTGSARSVDDINLYDALFECSELLEKFGGHFHAAGLTLKTENVPLFVDKFDAVVRQKIGNKILIPQQIIEKELPFNELFQAGESTLEVPRLMRVMDQFEPYGPENMKPLFLAKNVYAQEVKLLKGEHLKMSVYQPEDKKIIDAIYFNCPQAKEIVDNQPFDMVFTVDRNEWKGRTKPQLMVKDIRGCVV